MMMVIFLAFSSVQSLSHVRLFETPWTTACQASNPSPSPGACSNSCPLSQWCHPTISSSVIPFSSRLQSFPTSGSFPMSGFFASGGKKIGVSASASVLPMNIQDWFPLGWTGWISLQSQGLSRVFSNTTVQKHWFFGTQAFCRLKWSESCSVVPDSLYPIDYTVHGILQARILECVAFPSSRVSSQPRSRTRTSCIAGGFFTNWAIRAAQIHIAP